MPSKTQTDLITIKTVDKKKTSKKTKMITIDTTGKKTDLLLINPTLTWNYEEMGEGCVQPPLGMLYLSSYLKSKGDFTTGFIDIQALQLSRKQTLEKIKEYNPRIVGFNTYTINVSRANEVAEDIKKWNKDVVVIMGGPHATALPEEVLAKCPAFDYVVFGEGEVTCYELVDRIKRGRKIDKTIQGVAWRKDGKPVRNEKRPMVENLDDLPFPDRELLDWKLYTRAMHRAMGGKDNAKFTSMITSRGCPFLCKFCDKTAFGATWRSRSPKDVVDEFEYLIEKYQVDEVVVHDDLLTMHKKRVLEICDELIDRNVQILWTADARVHTVDYEMLKKMRDAGCYSIFFGVESGNQEILDKMNKAIRLQQVRNAIGAAKKANMVVTASFMIGNLGETPETVQDTIDFAKELNPDIAEFYICTPFPGSALYSILKSQNKLRVNDWSDYSPHTNKPVFDHDGLTDEQMLFYYKKAYREYYMRPRYILSQLKNIRGSYKIYWKGLKNYVRASFGRINY